MINTARIVPLLTLLAFLISMKIRAQGNKQSLTASPLSIPLRASGTFQELRGDHFHSGTDLKTQYRTGKVVKSVADGYVYRINVAPGGYGRALYIRHDSLLSVYAHLQRFAPKIETFVKHAQYKLKSFKVNLFLTPGRFPIEQGDTIGWSGNSGSSAGPHLHYEIRDFDTEHPLNAQNYGLSLKDHRPPVVYDMYFYHFPDGAPVGFYQRKKIPLRKYRDTYKALLQEPIGIPADFAPGIRTFDYLDGSSNKCGLYNIVVTLDADTVFHFQADEFAFRNTRYINSLLDRKAYFLNDKKIMKLFREPHNKLRSYKILQNNGIISLADDSVHTLKLTLADHARNTTRIAMKVRRKKVLEKKDGNALAGKYTLDYRKSNQIRKKGAELLVPDSALYTNYFIEFSQNGANQYGKRYQIGQPFHVFQHPVKIRLKASLPEELRSKVLIKRYADDDTDYLPARYRQGFVEVRTRQLGRFAIGADTTAPEISSLNVYKGKLFSEGDELRFRIEDDKTGIASWEGKINDRWILMEYDAKNKLLFHSYAPRLYEQTGERRNFRLKVSDKKGNTATYSTEIRY